MNRRSLVYAITTLVLVRLIVLVLYCLAGGYATAAGLPNQPWILMLVGGVALLVLISAVVYLFLFANTPGEEWYVVPGLLVFFAVVLPVDLLWISEILDGQGYNFLAHQLFRVKLRIGLSVSCFVFAFLTAGFAAICKKPVGHHSVSTQPNQ